MIDESLVKLERKEIAIETRGEFTRGLTFNVTDSNWWNGFGRNFNANVCVDVDVKGFPNFLCGVFLVN